MNRYDLPLRRNDEVEGQRSRWTFYETIIFCLTRYHISYIYPLYDFIEKSYLHPLSNQDPECLRLPEGIHPYGEFEARRTDPHQRRSPPTGKEQNPSEESRKVGKIRPPK
jgi:hypothetical protein